MVRAKTEMLKCHAFWPFWYDKKHNVYRRPVKLVPSHRQRKKIAQNTVEYVWYEIQLWQWIQSIGNQESVEKQPWYERPYSSVSEHNEWLITTVKDQKGHHVRQYAIGSFHGVQYNAISEMNYKCYDTKLSLFHNSKTLISQPWIGLIFGIGKSFNRTAPFLASQEFLWWIHLSFEMKGRKP